MIGIIEYMGSPSGSSKDSCMELKRLRLIDTGASGTMDLAKLKRLSTPPTWHTSLKQHLGNITTVEFKNPISLNNVTDLLVDSGYVSIVEVYRMSQTCKELYRTTMKRQSTWKSLCMQEFPSGTRQIPPIIVKERGYKWLYREWKSTIHSSEASRKRAKTYVPLPPPRLSVDQIMICIHLNGQGDRPLHKLPIVVAGSALSPLLNDGKMTYFFPEPIIVPSTNVHRNGMSESANSHHLHVRMHFLSIPDASMCCIYNEAKALPLHLCGVVNHRAVDTMIHKLDLLHATMKSSSTTKIDAAIKSAVVPNSTSHEQNHIYFGPSDTTTYYNCELRLRNSSTAVEIKQRLCCSTTVLLRVGLCLADGGGTMTANQEKHTHDNGFVAVAGLCIEVMKFDRALNSCSPFDREQMEDKNGGVTILHYLLELQLS